MENNIKTLKRLGYAVDPVQFFTGRPDRTTFALTMQGGRRAIGKVYPSGGGELAYSNMRRLWCSSFGARRNPPGLAKPIEFLDDAGILVMERVAGCPLVELGYVEKDTIDEAIRLLASLHESDAQPPRRRTFKRIIRSMDRKAQRVAELAPEFSRGFQRTVGALRAAHVEDRELVPSHGDFSSRNVLVGPGGVSLIDWDRFQLADPARDVAYFGTWDWAWKMRRKRCADWSTLERTVASYQALRPGARVEERLRFHVAAGLLRIVHALIEMWPEDADVSSTLIDESLRQLR